MFETRHRTPSEEAQARHSDEYAAVHISPETEEDDKPKIEEDDEPEIEVIEHEITLGDEDIQLIDPKKPPLPPEHLIFQRKGSESRWPARKPETEKSPLSDEEIEKNQTLKSFEIHIPAAYKEYLSFGEILRNAGFTNDELRHIKNNVEFTNLMAQIDYETSKAIFEAGFAPDDQTYLVNEGQLPHYREELTLNKDKTAIVGRKKRETSEFIAKIKKEDAEKAAALEKLTRQKTYLLAIGSALSRKAMIEFGKKES